MFFRMFSATTFPEERWFDIFRIELRIASALIARGSGWSSLEKGELETQIVEDICREDCLLPQLIIPCRAEAKAYVAAEIGNIFEFLARHSAIADNQNPEWLFLCAPTDEARQTIRESPETAAKFFRMVEDMKKDLDEEE